MSQQLLSDEAISVATTKRPDAIRIGLCGIGRTGFGRVRREISALPECVIAAGFDVIRERADQLAHECGSTVHDSFQSLLADKGVDVVVIATRSYQHAEMAIAALDTGKHVVVEKPMATTLAGADAMIAAAARSPGKLMVRHSRRFDPEFIAARRAIESGKLGTPHLVKIRHHEYVRRTDWQTLREFGGGQLLNWGPHLIDWALQLLGSPAKEVWSDCRRIAAAGDAEDHVKLLIRGENGCVADVEISGATAIPEPQFVIAGSRGAMSIDGQTCRLRYLKNPDIAATEATGATPDQRQRPRLSDDLEWIEEICPVGPLHPGQFWIEVYRHLRLGVSFPITLDQARQTMRVIELARPDHPSVD